MSEDKVPESDEVLERMSTDPDNPLGWIESKNNPIFGNRTYWWVRIGDLYLGVLPEGWQTPDGRPINGHPWFISQGRKGNADLEPKMLAEGDEETPEKARMAATMWYNRNRNDIPERRP
jgi:hypothetical protein